MTWPASTAPSNSPRQLWPRAPKSSSAPVPKGLVSASLLITTLVRKPAQKVSLLLSEGGFFDRRTYVRGYKVVYL